MKDRPEASSTWDGRDLKAMFAAATALLEANASQINALNVFPVPDGDTGTNLLFTMRSSMESANKSPGESAAAVAQAMAQGALMGARGNSGVILSQILRGIAKSLDGRSSFGSRELVVAFSEASAAAYRAVSRPVEGTILTVIREAAAAAEARAATDGDDIVAIWGVATVAAREAVAKTPSLLPVLREAGVVDAGGLGLYILMDGAWRHMRGERVTEFAQATAGPWRLAEGSEFSTFEDEEPYGYCTEFLLYGSDLKSEEFRDKIATMGQSVIVVGDEVLLRVHIHALDPGAVLSYATSLGTILQVKVENMEDQHVDFLAMQPDKALVVGDIAIVAVVSGEGLANVFRSLGTAAIVPGGSSMNPSTQELLQAIESVSVDKVILLPNDKNVVLSAHQAKTLTTKKVAVVATESVPQGVAALLAYNYEDDMETNAAAMEEARRSVHTLEITRAVRSVQMGGFQVTEGQPIVFLDGELRAVGGDLMAVLEEALASLDLSGSEVVTLYYGSGVEVSQAEAVAEDLRRRWSGLQMEVVYGGQPYYPYIVSVEQPS